jgi:hypothetical protein
LTLTGHTAEAENEADAEARPEVEEARR